MLIMMLDAVYVDMAQGLILGLKPKPEFLLLFNLGEPVTIGDSELVTGRRGRLQLLIPYFLCRHYSGKKGSVFRLRFDIDELFPVDGDPPEYLPNQSLPLLVGHPGV